MIVMLFSETSLNCFSAEYIETDNNLGIFEEVNVSTVDWRETLR